MATTILFATVIKSVTVKVYVTDRVALPADLVGCSGLTLVSNKMPLSSASLYPTHDETSVLFIDM
jgi:hypothetical protein